MDMIKELHSVKRNLILVLYYSILQRLPNQPMPGWGVSQKLRGWAVKNVLKSCGRGVRVKDHCYFGDGSRLVVGDRSALGVRSTFNGTITIGEDCNMGPGVVMMAGSHETSAIDKPINMQGAKSDKPIVIGDDCWIGTKVVIMPGVHVGDRVIIGAGSIVRCNIPHYAIVAGNPAKIVGFRFTPEEIEEYESALPEEKRHNIGKIRKVYDKYYFNRKEQIADYLSL